VDKISKNPRTTKNSQPSGRISHGLLVAKKARGTRRFDGWDKNNAAFVEENDARLPLRESGSMWKMDIPERVRKCDGETFASLVEWADRKTEAALLILF
jgi:hypothetical protein